MVANNFAIKWVKRKAAELVWEEKGVSFEWQNLKAHAKDF